MTIEQKAREIAERMAPAGDVWDADVERISLGIIEGLEMAAKVAENWPDRYEGAGIAQPIRALIEEQRPLGTEFEAVWDANTERLYEP